VFGKKSLRVPDSPQGGWTAPMEVDHRFRDLVERLSIDAAQRPNAYRLRVILAALIGYAFIVTVVILLLGIAVLSLAAIFFAKAGAVLEVKIAIVAGLVAVALLRSMAVQAYRAEGILVTAGDAPRLFELIERIRRDVNGPGLDAVYITDELNASMTQPARYWLFGVRNIMSIGLPMTMALTERELASVIAHELGHSVGGHGRWASFVYRVRIRWMQVAERLPQGIIAGLLRRFFSWYGPWFNAYSFVLARKQEYEADQMAAHVATSAVAGSALIRIELQTDRFGDHWGRVWSESRLADRPSAMPYATVESAFRTAKDADEVLLERALAGTTGLDDTHPSLADRLAALPAPAALPDPLERTAAETLLGPFAEELAARLDDQWWSSNGEWWRTLHSQAKDEVEEYAKLRASIDAGEATLRDRQRFIDLAAIIDGEDAAIAARRDALAALPWAHTVRYFLGVSLLAAGEREGVEHIEAAIVQAPSLAMPGYRAIAGFLNGASDVEAERYQKLLEACEANEPLANEEFNSIDETAVMLPLELEAAQRVELVASLSEIAGLKRVAAAQRILKFNGRQIVFVFDHEAGASPHEILDSIIERMLDYADVLGLERTRSNAWLAARIEPIHGSVLFER
jgi:Zn-dependent protease with chaperone function